MRSGYLGSFRRLRSINLPHPATLSYLLHRLSGLALILFIPFHLLLAGRALAETTSIPVTDWRANPSFGFSVAMLLGLLAMHIVGGIRVIVIEWLGKSGGQWRWLQLMLVAPLLVAALVGWVVVQ